MEDDTPDQSKGQFVISIHYVWAANIYQINLYTKTNKNRMNNIHVGIIIVSIQRIFHQTFTAWKSIKG